MSKESGPEWEERQKKVNRIIELLGEEFGEEISELGDDLWLVMQMLLGPVEASCAIRRSQVN